MGCQRIADFVCPRDVLLEASPTAFFSAECLWSTTAVQPAVSNTAKGNESFDPTEFYGVSSVPSSPQNPFVRMPHPSSSKSHQSDLGSRHQHKAASTQPIPLTADALFDVANASAQKKQSPTFPVPIFKSSPPLVLFLCYKMPKWHSVIFPSSVYLQPQPCSIKL